MENEIIYIALSDQIIRMQHILENKLYEDEEQYNLYKLILDESMKLLDKYMPEKPQDIPISRPQF